MLCRSYILQPSGEQDSKTACFPDFCVKVNTMSTHIYPHTALLTILDAVRVLPISSMYQNFNVQFTSPLSSLASVLPLMLPLFGIHFLKTSVQTYLYAKHILLSSFSLMVSPWCRPVSVPGL